MQHEVFTVVDGTIIVPEPPLVKRKGVLHNLVRRARSSLWKVIRDELESVRAVGSEKGTNVLESDLSWANCGHLLLLVPASTPRARQPMDMDKENDINIEIDIEIDIDVDIDIEKN